MDDWWEMIEQGVDAVRHALDNGLDVNEKYENGLTMLMGAVINYQFEVVRLLLEAGADVHVRDRNGWTALMFAAERNSKLVALLFKKGSFLTPDDAQKVWWNWDTYKTYYPLIHTPPPEVPAEVCR